MAKNPVIQYTKNYDTFKRFDSNRDVNKNHLRRLVQSISSKNLLYLFPIVVNIHREIIDGQHRLEAARQLDVEIYYLIDGSVTKADIAMVNNSRKGWASMDYVLFYAKEGVKPYADLRKLLKFYPLSIIQAARLMQTDCLTASGGGGITSMDVRAGKYLGGDYDTARKICDVANELLPLIPFVFDSILLMEIKRALYKEGMTIDLIKRRLKDGHQVIVMSEEKDGLPAIVRSVLARETRNNTSLGQHGAE